MEHLLADRTPLFYRSPRQIADTLDAGYFRTAFREALVRLPTSSHFRRSHFGEILSAIFAQEVIGWRLIYSKLRLLTTPNANPHKADLVFFDPNQRRPTFVIGEVKSSMKDTVPAGHDKACFPSLFASLRNYAEDDLEYDLGAAKDNVEELPRAERDTVRAALLPYAERDIRYAGFSVIDTSTKADGETTMLAKRKSPKAFDIDLLCVDDIAQVADSTYGLLDGMRNV